MGGTSSTPEQPPPPDPSASDTPSQTETPSQTPTISNSPSSTSSFSLPSRWYCYPDTGTNQITRRNKVRDIECFALNGYSCLTASTYQDCNSFISQYSSQLNPLRCGSDHLAKYGISGYLTPGHWCAINQAIIPDFSSTATASSTSSATPTASGSASGSGSSSESYSTSSSVSSSSSASITSSASPSSSSSFSASTTTSPSSSITSSASASCTQSVSETGSSSTTVSPSSSASSSMSASAKESRSSSASPSPSAHARGPPPSLPNLDGDISPEYLNALLEDFSYYDPILVKDSLLLLGRKGLEMNNGNFLIETDAFVMQLLTPPTENQTLTVAGITITMPPFGTLYPDAAATSILQWTSNPYANDTQKAPDSPTMSIDVLDSSNQPIEVSNLKEPIHMKWELTFAPDDPRFLPLPIYIARCDRELLYIDNGDSIRPFENATKKAKGSWEVPCLLNSYLSFNCTSFQPLSIQEFQCPPPIITPECMYWSPINQTWQNDGCRGVQTGPTTVECVCDHLTDFSSRLNAVAQTNENVFKNAGNVYSMDGLAKYAQWYGIFGGIAAVTLLLGALVVRLDRKATKKYVKAICKDPTIEKIVRYHPNIPLYSYNSHAIFTEATQDDQNVSVPESTVVINKAINKHPIRSLVERIFLQHSRLQIFFKFDPRLNRLYRLLFLFVIQFHSLFVTALLHGFTYGDKKEMEISESIILAILTSALNIPIVKLMFVSLNRVGILEFEKQFNFIHQEYNRRVAFETLALEYLEAKETENTIHASEEQMQLGTEDAQGCLDIVCMHLVCKKRATQPPKKISRNLLKKQMINLVHSPYTYIQTWSSIWSYFPCHTWQGAVFIFASFGWLGWCLNYLLLFAASQEQRVGQDIMVSYATSELSTIFIQQPLNITILLLIYYLLNKYQHRIPEKVKAKIIPKAVNSIPSLFYFSNPFSQQTKSIFTAEFAYAVFVSCAAKASGSHEYSYAPLKAIIAEFNQATDRKDAQECEIAKLYDECLKEGHSKAILQIRNPIVN